MKRSIEKMIDNIKNQNNQKLKTIIINMNQLSKEVSKENNKVKVKKGLIE